MRMKTSKEPVSDVGEEAKARDTTIGVNPEGRKHADAMGAIKGCGPVGAPKCHNPVGGNTIYGGYLKCCMGGSVVCDSLGRTEKGKKTLGYTGDANCKVMNSEAA